MLQIGDFSARTGISVHMLRHYDKIGLLRPESVDRISGYRYYSETQIVAANRIQVLKSLGFGLKEISGFRLTGILDDTVRSLLNAKISEKERLLAETDRQLAQIRQALQELDHGSEGTLSVAVKTLPPRNVVSLRGVLREFSEEGLLWEQIAEKCRKHGVRFADASYCFAVTHHVDFKKRRIDTEVLRIVEKTMPDMDGLRFFEIPEMLAAAVAYRGTYGRLGDINAYLSRWIAENGYQICGSPFHTYYVSPETEPDPENFITEICFPISR